MNSWVVNSWAVMGTLSLLLVGCNNAPIAESEPASTESPAVETVESAIAPSPTDAPNPVEESVASSPGSNILKSGTFVSGEHPTEGTVRLVNQDGKLSLELDSNFQTDAGPDLVVILHRSEDVIGSTQPPAHAIAEGDYVVLAPLQQVTGTQSYSIPETINVEDYQSAAIWCRQFNATFGAAPLRSTEG